MALPWAVLPTEPMALLISPAKRGPSLHLRSPGRTTHWGGPAPSSVVKALPLNWLCDLGQVTAPL